MADNSNISWTTHTWNCVIGCSRVSPGCENCYAETLALRYHWTPKPWKAQFAKENVILKPHRLREPYRWKEPARVFVNSLSDVFHEQIPDSYRDQMFDVMEDLPRHQFQILTKRPDVMQRYVVERARREAEKDGNSPEAVARLDTQWLGVFTASNIWLGVSVEDQRRADERIPLLLETPAAVRFISAEPLLGPVDLDPFLWEEAGPPWAGKNLAEPGLDWVIVGGESGSGYRSMDLWWALQLQRQCLAASVAFFFKQVSAFRPGQGADALGRLYHEFPAELVRAQQAVL